LARTGREPHDKRETLRQLIRGSANFKNAIIFCNRKREVAQLHRSLLRHGFNAAALHGDMDQPARMAALDSFRKGDVSLLIASDVAARGLDIPDVSHIFNFDVPHHADDYVHRIGRTGRAGKSGTAVTVVAPSDGKALAAIEHLIGQSIPWMSGEAPRRAEASPEPRANGRGKHAHAPKRERGGSPPNVARAPNKPNPAPVALLDDVRPVRARQRPSRNDDVAAADHLPAFLLRPVRVKA